MEQVANAVMLSQAKAAKGGKGVLELTMSITQAVKAFKGIMSQRVEVDKKGNTITVAEWFEGLGVHLKRNAKGFNPELTVKALLEAWSIVDEQGKPAMYRNCTGATPGATDNTWTRVYILDKDAEYVPAKMMKLCTVSAWTPYTIIKGLQQCAFKVKYEAKAKKSEEAWNDYTGGVVTIKHHRATADEVRHIKKEAVVF